MITAFKIPIIRIILAQEKLCISYTHRGMRARVDTVLALSQKRTLSRSLLTRSLHLYAKHTGLLIRKKNPYSGFFFAHFAAPIRKPFRFCLLKRKDPVRVSSLFAALHLYAEHTELLIRKRDPYSGPLFTHCAAPVSRVLSIPSLFRRRTV